MLSNAMLAAWLTFQTGDLITTCQGHARNAAARRAGQYEPYREINPAVPTNCVGAVGITAGLNVSVITFTQRNIKSGKKRAIVYGLLAGVEAVTLVRNMNTLKRR